VADKLVGSRVTSASWRKHIERKLRNGKRVLLSWIGEPCLREQAEESMNQPSDRQTGAVHVMVQGKTTTAVECRVASTPTRSRKIFFASPRERDDGNEEKEG